MSDPTTYLSMSDGKFRVINQALPVTADKPTASEALTAAARCSARCFVADGDTVWDGDTCSWRDLQDVLALEAAP